MQFLNSSRSPGTHIYKPKSSCKEKAEDFIEMINFLRNLYEGVFDSILMHVLFITEREIDQLTFTDEQFNRLLDFYLKQNKRLNDQFIKMIEAVNATFNDSAYKILEQQLKITKWEIYTLNYTEDQFKRLMDFYISNIAEEVNSIKH